MSNYITDTTQLLVSLFAHHSGAMGKQATGHGDEQALDQEGILLGTSGSPESIRSVLPPTFLRSLPRVEMTVQRG